MNSFFWGLLSPLFLSKKLHIIQQFTILPYTDAFSAWPTVAINSKGTLFIGYSGGRFKHVDPFGKNYLIKSHDLGITWSNPILVNNSPLDDRDAGLLILPDDTLIYSSFNSNYYKTHLDLMIEFYGSQVKEEWKEYLEKEITQKPGSSLRISKDDGESFSESIPIPVSTPHGPILGLDKKLYFIGNRTDNSDLEIYSSSDGFKWDLHSFLFPAKIIPKTTLCEPHLVQTGESSFLALFRANQPWKWKRKIYESVSHDGGRRWSYPKSTGIWGTPPHLLRPSNGSLILSYGYRAWPYSIKIATSCTNGDKWQKEGAIDIGKHEDLGYPSTVQLPDKSYFTVFYDEGSLKATRWNF